jgi:GT2 family glycosyltransferase
MPDRENLTIMLTCYNRRETTLECLGAIEEAVQGAISFSIVLVDDGSTDGTAEAVHRAFPEVMVIAGTGQLYWNSGMRLAWQRALQFRPNFYMWLNDDTILRAGSIAEMLRTYRESSAKRTIVVGRTTDSETGVTTYGGYRRVERSISKLRFRHLANGETECDTMNGNCVLFPASVVLDVGLNAKEYRHWAGDVDYGLRARRCGYRILQAISPVASQKINANYKKSTSELNFRNWRFVLFHPKGVPVREWLTFCRRFGGWCWPVNFVLRYLKIVRLH